MSATNGSILLRSRSGLVGSALAAMLVVFAMSASAAFAGHGHPIKETQLTLGDSLAFGFSEQLLNENYLAGDPATAFENGYANDYLNLHNPTAHGIQLVNLGCPGETTDSLMGTGTLGSALDPTAEAACAYHNVEGLPLHHEYGGGKSQLEAALEVLVVEASSGTPVTTITLNIGANDELHAIGKCKAEVTYEFTHPPYTSKYGATPEAAVLHCLIAHVGELFTHVLTNVGTTLHVLREGSKFGSINYTGKIVIQGGYDPYGNVYGTGEVLAESNTLASLLNGEEAAVAAAFGACYANPQSKFNPKNKNEPTALQRYTNMNNHKEDRGKKFGEAGADGPDIHATPAGYLLLAHIMKADCG